MKKPVATVMIFAVLVMLSACKSKPGKITSSSRYVTPAMIQQIQKAVEEMPDEKDGKANEILKADVLSAFNRDGAQETETEIAAETKPQENQQHITEEQTTATEAQKNKPDKQESKQQEKPSVTEKAKPEPVNNKTNIGAVPDGETVYVSENGKKFHKTPDCSGMKSPVATTRSEAEISGKTYCKKCYE